jgi:hypothetical protein
VASKDRYMKAGKPQNAGMCVRMRLGEGTLSSQLTYSQRGLWSFAERLVLQESRAYVEKAEVPRSRYFPEPISP